MKMFDRNISPQIMLREFQYKWRIISLVKRGYKDKSHISKLQLDVTFCHYPSASLFIIPGQYDSDFIFSLICVFTNIGS